VFNVDEIDTCSPFMLLNSFFSKKKNVFWRAKKVDTFSVRANWLPYLFELFPHFYKCPFSLCPLINMFKLQDALINYSHRVFFRLNIVIASIILITNSVDSDFSRMIFLPTYTRSLLKKYKIKQIFF